MRIALVSWRHWGLIACADRLGPEFEVLSVATEYISYQDLVGSYPSGWRPDAIVCWGIDYSAVPEGLEEAGCFTAAVVGDWNMAGQSLHCIGDAFDVLIADLAGCEVLTQSGFRNVRHALLWGYVPEVHRRLDGVDRDLDVLFVGNFNQGVQAHRAAWLARVAQLSDRYRVLLATNVFGDEFGRLMNRARIVFNRSIRGELNQRAYEAPACGALMFLERGNREVGEVFADRQECVLYGEDDLEELLAYYLSHEDERAQIAEAGHRKVQPYSAEQCLRRLLQVVRAAKDEIGQTDRPFRSLPSLEKDVQRAWQWLRTSSNTSVQAAATVLDRAQAAEPRPDVLNVVGCLMALTTEVMKDANPDMAQTASLRAIDYENRALELFPEFATALYNLGNVMYQRSEMDRAEGFFVRAREVLELTWLGVEHVFGPYYRSPGWSTFEVQMDLAWSLHPFGSHEWLNAVKTTLLWHTLVMLNDIALAQQRFGQAAYYAREACRLVPDNPTSQPRLALSLLRSGDLSRSADEFVAAMLVAPLIEWVWVEGLAVLRLAGHPRFEEMLRRAERLARACPALESLRAALPGGG